MFAALWSLQANAQSEEFADDVLGRGYIDRPYLRYEAEAGKCSSHDIDFIDASDFNHDQSVLASEASNGCAAMLPARGSSLTWTLCGDADALTVRFSLPDSADGKGTRQTIEIHNNGTKIADLMLDSYWAWQYTVKAAASEKYPDNEPADNKFARMRFDEVCLLLPEVLKEGDELSLVRVSDEGDSITIDFVEAEMAGAALVASDYGGEVVEFEGTGAELQAFVSSNGGKTIYIPAGMYEIPTALEIRDDNTRIVGAGMWHTTLMFTASPDNKRTYGRRGVVCSRDGCGLENLTLNTLNNRRYFNNISSQQMGKAISGSWGKASTICNVRAEHFECGAWIADYNGNSSSQLVVEDCRFRNNYADGINLCSGTRDALVRNCSFRNNGDDDMASWSVGNETSSNTFENCTAENNWRASSLGFFGGRGNKASAIAIYDGMENGVRVNADFDGTGFASQDEFVIENMSIRRCGTVRGATGTHGDFWGNAQAALLISAGYHYDVNNVRLENILISDCRYEGVRVQSTSGKSVSNLTMRNIRVERQGDEGLAFDFAPGLRGYGSGENLIAEECAEPVMSEIPSTFDFSLNAAIEHPEIAGKGTMHLYSLDGHSLGCFSKGSCTSFPKGLVVAVEDGVSKKILTK